MKPFCPVAVLAIRELEKVRNLFCSASRDCYMAARSYVSATILCKAKSGSRNIPCSLSFGNFTQKRRRSLSVGAMQQLLNMLSSPSRFPTRIHLVPQARLASVRTGLTLSSRKFNEYPAQRVKTKRPRPPGFST